MPTLVQALMQGGAAFMRGEAQALDVREQRRQQSLLQALQMQDVLERRRMAERGQTFEEMATRARLGLQQQSQQGLERYRASTLGLQERGLEADLAQRAQQQAAARQATAFNVQGRIGPQPLAWGEVQAAPLTLERPLAGPVMELPGAPGPRITQPRLLSAQGEPLAQDLARPLGQAQAQPLRGATLPVPTITEEMLAAPLTPISQAPLAPQAIPTATQPWTEAPYGETLAAAAGIPNVQFGQQAGVVTAQVPTEAEAEEAAWQTYLREDQRVRAEFFTNYEMPERLAEIGEAQVERAVRQVLRETGYDPDVLNAMLLANNTRISELQVELAEETAPEAKDRIRAALRGVELDNDVAQVALDLARYQLGYLEEHGYLPPAVSEHRSYAEYGPERAGIEADKLSLAEGRLELDSARHRLAAAEQAGAPGAAPTDAQGKAVTAAMKLIQTLYDDAMAEEEVDARLLLPQLKVYMQQAGPLSVEIQRALWATYESIWEQEYPDGLQHTVGAPRTDEPQGFEQFPWDELYAITGQYGIRRGQPSGAAQGAVDAAPFGGRPGRPATAPP